MNSPSVPPDFGKSLLTSIRWVLVLRTMSQTLSWLSTIIVVRFVTPEDYGLNTMLQAPLELIFLFCTLGLESGLVRVKVLETIQLRSAFGWLLVANIALFVGYYASGALLAAGFSEPRLETRAQARAVIFLVVPLRAVPNAQLDRELKLKVKAKGELIS